MFITTLNPFGTWLAVHWVLYTITVTAFMSIFYVAKNIILELYEKEDVNAIVKPTYHVDSNLLMSSSLQSSIAYSFSIHVSELSV